ncbi:glycosyltransferase family 4 protein [Flavobacterium pallidum]|uniref:Group 1 glycosyl transferase n=1 Tax=Flavobacterium pallidum TaxID=2172098 RepID=A0A2S1SGY6_9FLAO|nr:glycosyltransferase family 4 protein [Flavobacterium pallidum]AWI25674.1 group 1 glycosyl transferase [Flavobacterium pallidum]
MNRVSNIAVICNYKLLPERIGGMDYFFWLFDKKCKENGIEVDWFFPNMGSHGHYGKLNIIASGNHPEVFFIKEIEQNNKQYSHVMMHFVELCTKSSKRIKELTHAKIIAVDHNPRPLAGYPFKKKLEKKVKGLLYSRYTDVFVAVSEQTRKDLIFDFGRFITSKSIIIFNGLNPENFRKKTDFNYKGKFITASHLRESKGIQDLISAVANLPEKPDFKIDIYGAGPYEQQLREMVDQLSVNAFFDFRGSVSNLHEIYADYDYLIHPSHAETFCYTVVESLMSNLPVITTIGQGNVLNLVEADVNGFLYNPGDTAGLEMILSDIVLQRKSIKNGLAKNPRTNALTLDFMVENYVKLLS